VTKVQPLLLSLEEAVAALAMSSESFSEWSGLRVSPQHVLRAKRHLPEARVIRRAGTRPSGEYRPYTRWEIVDGSTIALGACS
jgi:hypothetical protein